MSLVRACLVGLANALPRLDCCNALRLLLLRAAGMSIGPGCIIWGPIVVTPYAGLTRVSLGARSFVNVEARFGCPEARVSIGDDVQIGPRVSFETVNHGLIYRAGQGRGAECRPIVVENGAWLASGVIVLPGVTIGEGAVVMAGAVVNRDVPPYTLVGGVPARVIRILERPGTSDASAATDPAALRGPD